MKWEQRGEGREGEGREYESTWKRSEGGEGREAEWGEGG